MFDENKVFSSSEVELDSASTMSGGGRHGTTATPMPTTHRIAELVHHLGDVPMSEARRAVRRSGRTWGHHDPLEIVAGALAQLRRDSRRCVDA